MAATIIGREKEREKLDKILRSNQAEFLALYGRRRVGKTFLIRQHLKDKLEEIESEITMDKLFER